MKKPREFWINANNWHSIDDKPFNCDDIIHVREVSPEYDAAVGKLTSAVKAYIDTPSEDARVIMDLHEAYAALDLVRKLSEGKK